MICDELIGGLDRMLIMFYPVLMLGSCKFILGLAKQTGEMTFFPSSAQTRVVKCAELT